MDFLHLIPEEGDAVRIIVRKGKNVDQGAADGILPRLRDEIHPGKLLLDQDILEVLEGDFIKGKFGGKTYEILHP